MDNEAFWVWAVAFTLAAAAFIAVKAIGTAAFGG
jgi:hypothetical protein